MAKEILETDLPLVDELVKRVLHAERYARIQRMGGLTNHTYAVTLENGARYVVRIPGEGTEELIVRKDEKKSTELACSLQIDAELLYFGEDGSKVTQYIENAVTMSAESMNSEENIRLAAGIFKRLHTCGADTHVPFEVFDMAAGYEKIIAENGVGMFEDYPSVKEEVMKIKASIDAAHAIVKVPCHNDPLCENWVRSGARMYLIDWEYAGMNDAMWDLADLSIEAGYDRAQDEILLSSYLVSTPPRSSDWKHFFASKIYVDYLWTLWAKTRVPYDGKPMEDWAEERYLRLKNNLKQFHTLG